VVCQPNGVDAERFAPAPSPARSCLPAPLRNPARVIFGTVGRLQAVKDQATLIRAFAHRATQGSGPTPGLVLVGDGPLRGELQQLVASLNLGDAVFFAGPSDRVPELMQAMDVFVLPSLNEGISNTLLEAMATGLPVLATRVGGNGELFEAGREGEFFSPGDVAGLAGLMQAMAADSARRAAYGRAARARVDAQFSLPRMMAGYARFYAEALGSEGQSG